MPGASCAERVPRAVCPGSLSLSLSLSSQLVIWHMADMERRRRVSQTQTENTFHFNMVQVTEILTCPRQGQIADLTDGFLHFLLL